MKFQELDFLADENISPKVVAFLRSRGRAVLDVKEQGWRGRPDDELLEIGNREKRWILTHDSDFGTLAIHEGKPCFGVVFLRVRNLQPGVVIEVCKRLLHQDLDFPQNALVVVEDAQIRIRRTEEG